MKIFKNYFLIGLLVPGLLLTSCGNDDEPAEENEEEIINEVTLTFTPDGGGTPVVATYVDADGEGPEAPVLSNITLAAGTSYALSITLQNTLETPAEDITEEIEEEDDEHQFFFAWTNGLFADPSGSGNIGTAGTVNYDATDLDDNGNPTGLLTNWTTTGSTFGGTFQVILKHQPGIKSATSTSNDGELDVDITWNISIN